MAEDTFIGAVAGVSLAQGVPPNGAFRAKVRGHAPDDLYDRPDTDALRQSLFPDINPGSAAVRADVNMDVAPK